MFTVRIFCICYQLFFLWNHIWPCIIMCLMTFSKVMIGLTRDCTTACTPWVWHETGDALPSDGPWRWQINEPSTGDVVIVLDVGPAKLWGYAITSSTPMILCSKPGDEQPSECKTFYSWFLTMIVYYTVCYINSFCNIFCLQFVSLICFPLQVKL